MSKVGKHYKNFEWDKKKYLTLSADDLKVVEWYADSSFKVHPDFMSHNGDIMTVVQVVMQ